MARYWVKLRCRACEDTNAAVRRRCLPRHSGRDWKYPLFLGGETEKDGIFVENQKRKKAKEEAGVYYFHVEDEVLQKHAEAYGNFNYTKEDESVADSKRAFQEMGVKAHGHMILIEASKFPGAVKAVNEYLSPQ